jgi:DNA-binding beta-propeller fold protein YncE
MATRKLILGSAASLILMSAAPVLAQSSDPAQAYSNAKAQYESDLQAYNQRQQAYERERSEYNAKITDYQRTLDAPVAVVRDPSPDVVVVDPEPSTTVVVDDPAATVVVRDPAPRVVVADPDPNVIVVTDNFADRLILDVPQSALVRLESIPDVNYAFFNVPVLDMAGFTVGHFRRIETKDPGVLVAVVTLDMNTQRRTISMEIEHVRLDPERRVVIADLTGREIALIPSGFPYG